MNLLILNHHLTRFSSAIFFSLLFLVTTALHPSPASAMGTRHLKEEQRNLPFFGDIRVNRFVYQNGLKLLVIEDSSSPTFSYQTWINVGSRDERPGKTGLAHLFEHMMFKETKNLKEGEFDQKLEAAGVVGKNAFTSFDYTYYASSLPSDKLGLIVDLESERYKNLVVNERAYRSELEVVKNERKFRIENSPDGILFETLFGTAFKTHPYRWPIIGYQKDLEGMTAEDARDFYRRFYNPSNTVIAIVGDIDSDRAARIIGEHYGNIPGQPVQALALIQPEKPQNQIRRKTLKLNIKLEKLWVAYHVPSISHEDAPKLEVLQAILTSGKSARLKRSLVNTGIATNVSSGSFQNKDPSLFAITASLQKGKRGASAERIILRELAKIAKKPISQREFQRAMNQIEFTFVNGLGSSDAKANFLGKHESSMGDYRSGIEFQANIQSVTPADIQGLIKKYFNPRSRTVIRGVPQS